MKENLIELYCTICQCNDSRFREALQRQSNNKRPQFTDEELITAYLWGKEKRLSTRRAIYDYLKDDLLSWFPQLPSYQAFCRRLNWLAAAFRALAEIFWEQSLRKYRDTHEYAVDSMPVILAHRSHSSRAKVAQDLCNKCFNATRKEWYYGVKLHVFAMLRPGKRPIPVAAKISRASLCDLWAAKEIEQSCMPIWNGKLFADRGYVDGKWARYLKAERNITIYTPRKKIKNAPDRSGDCFNTGISRKRQPIEAYFNWLNRLTHFQDISHIRSKQGLLFHVYSALAFAALNS